jgi:hypothetical protein
MEKRGKANSWFESYVKHQKQFIETNHNINTKLKQEKMSQPQEKQNSVYLMVQSDVNLIIHK